MRTSTNKHHFHLAPLNLCRRIGAAASVLAAVTTTSSAVAQYLPVYGGLAYDQTTQTGFSWPILLHVSPGSTAGNGAAVGVATKYAGGLRLGTRAVRWHAAGEAAVELGNLGTSNFGVTRSEAYAINPAGTAVGFAEKYVDGTSLEYRAVRWDASGTVATELGTFGADLPGLAYAINAAGTAVGFAGGAVRWDASGTATRLGNLGSPFSRAYAINDAGTAVGSSETASSISPHAVRWDASSTAATQLFSLGSVGGDASSEALCINSSGAAAGYSFKYVGPTSDDVGTRAVRWNASSTAATELGNLGTDTRGVTSSRAHAINDAGTAIGYADKYTGGANVGRRAVRWDAGGTAATELGNLGLPPFGETMANDINGAGVTVGMSHKSVNGALVGRAVLWDLDTIDAIDLNALIDPEGGWTLVEARGITDTNWISGVGIFDPDGAGGMVPYGRAFLIQVPSSALPEPSVACVMLIGAISLVRRGRRIKSS